MATAIKVPTVFTAVDKMTAVIKGMTKSVSTFSKKSGAYIQRFDQKVTNSFNKLGRITQLGLGIGMAGIFSMAIQGNLAYNESLASLEAITGATGKEMVVLENKVLSLAKKTGKSGAEVAKAFELVGSAKPELLKNTEALSQTTDAVITLSKASKLDLETSAQSLTGVMNQFSLGAEHSARTINVLAAGAKEGAAAIPEISESILKFGTAAAASNVTLEESVALVETLAEKGIKGAEAGTGLRNILTKLSATGALPKEAIAQLEKYGVNVSKVADNSIPFTERLKEISKISDDATAMVKVFGLENQTAAKILFDNISTYDRLTEAVTGTTEAERMAAVNSSALVELVDRVKNSFTNATTATNSNSKALNAVKQVLFFVSENMETVVGIMAYLIGSFLLLKVVTGVIQAIEIATKLWTGAQWLLNVALNANPIGLIIFGVSLLIALVVTIIAKYDEWGASLAMLLGPFGFIINLIQSFRRHWDSIKEAFKTDGIVGGLKRIGAVILDALLMPMQQFLGLISKIPGVGEMVAPALKFIEGIRTNLHLEPVKPTEVTAEEMGIGNTPFIPSSAQQHHSRQETITERVGKGQLDINVNDKRGIIEDMKATSNLNFPALSTTNGQS